MKEYNSNIIFYLMASTIANIEKINSHFSNSGIYIIEHMREQRHNSKKKKTILQDRRF